MTTCIHRGSRHAMLPMRQPLLLTSTERTQMPHAASTPLLLVVSTFSQCLHH
ncbi:hypothetical protein IEO21_10634 [Rhodonia placenta]|uniref:Uncharacterized protein n=1 Tax=Rhodonia placenta TaxID=104341 RepID=A0A8H7NS52_9APHY|nr:hypothetical protein IEO21_10634 [Postia placenta]